MDESTIIPMPRVNPARVMMFRVRPEKYITITVTRRLMGMEQPMMMVLLRFRRKMKSTIMARNAPSSAVVATPARDRRIILVVS